MPFRDAHHVTGRLVGLASEKKIGLEKLSLAEMQAVEPSITEEVFAVLGVDQSVKSRTSYGGTAPRPRPQAGPPLAQAARQGMTRPASGPARHTTRVFGRARGPARE